MAKTAQSQYKPVPAPFQSQLLPIDGFLRLSQIIGCKRRGTSGLIPVSESTFLRKVRAGLYPKPIRHGDISFWKASEIRELISRIESGEI